MVPWGVEFDARLLGRHRRQIDRLAEQPLPGWMRGRCQIGGAAATRQAGWRLSDWMKGVAGLDGRPLPNRLA